MGQLETLSDRLWRGETSTRDKEHHPFVALDLIEEVADGVAFHKSFSNITAIKTGDGIVLLDTGSFHPVAHKRSFDKVRSWSGDPLRAAVYTHGHADHAYGLPPFLEEAKTKGWAAPEIIAHSLVNARMDRYIETAGFNSIINERQFGFPVEWPVNPIRPTVTYENEKTLVSGGVEFRLHHARGETDDHTWVFIPERGVICTGDFFIWSAPNAGNPQKVQRYAKEWSLALRAMAECGARVLLPGHGVPVFGADRVREALLTTADYLEHLHRATVELMNTGAALDDIVHAVKPPDALAEKPWLLPVYDEPEFIVRNVWRCMAGWWGGVASELKPAPRGEQAREIAALAGGVRRLLGRAREFVNQGNLRMACHLVDWAAEADPTGRETHTIRAEVYRRRTESESSTMSKGVFGAAARESEKKSKGE